MQDIEAAVTAGARRIFTHTERRLRLQTHNTKHQPLKCPRCDSLNTKFCYYNNYNLSQPRHFCKSCRRYWTKGGVLRNVPIGGGCRKPKRPKPPKTPIPSSNSSTSENSNLTNPDPCSAESESGFLLPTKTPDFQEGVFPNFTNLITDPSRILEGQEKSARIWGAEEMKMQEELLFPAAYDWQSGSGNGDHHFYELSSAVDQAYWTPNQWISDPDHQQPSLYLP